MSPIGTPATPLCSARSRTITEPRSRLGRPRLSTLPSLSEAEHRLKVVLGAHRQPQLREHPKLVRPLVAKPVRRACRNHQIIARHQDQRLFPEPYGSRPRKDLEPFLLCPVDMIGGHSTTGLEDVHPLQQFASGGRACLPEFNPLPTHRIRNRLPHPRHDRLHLVAD